MLGLGMYGKWKRIKFPESIIYEFGNNEAEWKTKK
jgi:hypothetical protein